MTRKQQSIVEAILEASDEYTEAVLNLRDEFVELLRPVVEWMTRHFFTRR